MDARHFDALTRVLSTADSRRRLLAAVPALGGLLGLFAAEETEGKGRRQRRKKRHKHGRRRRREKHTKQPRCAPDSDAQTCSGTCGSVQNNCRKMVDCGPCGCTGLTPSDDLQAAIDAAGSGATLTLCAGTWTPPATLEITRPLTIVGAGSEQTILDGGDQRRVLQITEDVAVTLQGFTITRGRDSFGGAGIYNTGNLALIDAVVTASHATASNDEGGGGGVLNKRALTLQRTRITANASTTFGGGINNNGGVLTLKQGSIIGGDTPQDANSSEYGGGILSTNGTVTLESGSRVSGNTGLSNNSLGGGILNAQSSVTLQGGSLVTGNSTGEAGGGIYQAGGTLTLMERSRVSHNTAIFGGGGIYMVAGELILDPGALICENSDPQCGGLNIGSCPTSPITCPV